MEIKSELRDFYSSHDGKVSDKWSLYIEEYENIFSSYKDKQLKLLEIGIQNGGSLEIWANYFKKFEAILGCDIDERCRNLICDNPRIKVIIGNANSAEVLATIKNISPCFDIMIDDGSHTSEDIIKTFLLYFPLLKENGIFIIEDLHASYWKEFGGGLFEEYSAMSFLKRLADVVNYESWGLKNFSRLSVLEPYLKYYKITLEEDFLQTIHSLKFINSMCFIEKKIPGENLLGSRILVGNDYFFRPAENGSSIPVIPQDNNVKKDPLVLFPEITTRNQELTTVNHQLSAKIEDLTTKIHETARINTDLETRIKSHESRISDLTNSLSWKITKPLRKLMRQDKPHQ